MDGELLSNIWIESCGTDVPIYIVEGSENRSYCIVDFEYLNTYYSISSDIDNEEFQKIIENILIKSE